MSVYVLVTQSCPILCDPTNCSLPGFSVYGILQARILEWIVIPFSRGFSWPRDQTLVSYIAGRFFTIWATGKSLSIHIKNQLTINIWAYFCTLCSVLFICLSILMPVPCCFYYCSFVVNYQLRSTKSPTVVFFLDCFDCFGPLEIPNEFEISLLIYLRKINWTFDSYWIESVCLL